MGYRAEQGTEAERGSPEEGGGRCPEGHDQAGRERGKAEQHERSQHLHQPHGHYWCPWADGSPAAVGLSLHPDLHRLGVWAGRGEPP